MAGSIAPLIINLTIKNSLEIPKVKVRNYEEYYVLENSFISCTANAIKSALLLILCTGKISFTLKAK